MKKTSGFKPKTVGEYLERLPEDKRAKLQQVRSAIRKVAPRAEEVISYNMPAFKQGRVLVWYAANKEHVGFYPKPGTLQAFSEELAAYKSSRGAVQFPLNKPMPVGLISKMVRYRIMEEESRFIPTGGFSPDRQGKP